MSLNANRHVTGMLRGFDQFMNIVLENAVDEKMKTDIGMVVRTSFFYGILPYYVVALLKPHTIQVIRGNSIITIEALDRL